MSYERQSSFPFSKKNTCAILCTGWLLISFHPFILKYNRESQPTVGGTIDYCSYLKARTPRITDDTLNIPMTPYRSEHMEGKLHKKNTKRPKTPWCILYITIVCCMFLWVLLHCGQLYCYVISSLHYRCVIQLSFNYIIIVFWRKIVREYPLVYLYKYIKGLQS